MKVMDRYRISKKKREKVRKHFLLLNIRNNVFSQCPVYIQEHFWMSLICLMTVSQLEVKRCLGVIQKIIPHSILCERKSF